MSTTYRLLLMDLAETKQLVGLGLSFSGNLALARVSSVMGDYIRYEHLSWADGRVMGERCVRLEDVQQIELRPACDQPGNRGYGLTFAIADDPGPWTFGPDSH